MSTPPASAVAAWIPTVDRSAAARRARQALAVALRPARPRVGASTSGRARAPRARPRARCGRSRRPARVRAAPHRAARRVPPRCARPLRALGSAPPGQDQAGARTSPCRARTSRPSARPDRQGDDRRPQDPELGRRSSARHSASFRSSPSVSSASASRARHGRRERPLADAQASHRARASTFSSTSSLRRQLCRATTACLPAGAAVRPPLTARRDRASSQIAVATSGVVEAPCGCRRTRAVSVSGSCATPARSRSSASRSAPGHRVDADSVGAISMPARAARLSSSPCTRHRQPSPCSPTSPSSTDLHDRVRRAPASPAAAPAASAGAESSRRS